MKLAKYLLLAILATGALGGCAYTNIRSPLDTGLERTELGTKSAVIVTMTDEEVIETDAGPVQVMPAREWFFRPTQG